MLDAITLVHADALALDERLEPRSFDYVHAGLFLHHLREDAILRVLRSMDRLARRGIVWNDLVRSRVGHLVITAMTIGKPRMIAARRPRERCGRVYTTRSRGPRMPCWGDHVRPLRLEHPFPPIHPRRRAAQRVTSPRARAHRS